MELSLKNVSAVIPTRGDVDMTPILESLPFDEIVLWDNAKRENLKVYGRYAAIEFTTSPYIYTQDDDCIVPRETILELMRAALPAVVTCNVTPAHRASYEPIQVGLVGWGAIFHRDLPFGAFFEYLKHWPQDDLFCRECDRIFTGQTPIQWLELPFEHLPHAGDRNKMFYDATHQSDFATVRERIAQLQ